MLKMGPAELRQFSHLLQLACAQLSFDIPDTPTIRVNHEGLIFVSDVWTSAMTREVLKVTISAGSVATKVITSDIIESTATMAALVIEKLFGPTLQVQFDRWAVARKEGLIGDDGLPSDLPYDRMLVDRTLAAILGDNMGHFKEVALTLSRNRKLQVGDELPSVPMGASDGLVVFARQIGKELPTVGSWVSLCRNPTVFFDGTYVAFDGPIPDTMVTATSGRRLGELIETGIMSLDRRAIKAIHSIGEHPQGITNWDEPLCYYVELESDLISLRSWGS